jgi:hypothetical protein
VRRDTTFGTTGNNGRDLRPRGFMRNELGDRSTGDRRRDRQPIVAVVFTAASSLFILGFLSPQIGQVGRGLRLGLPAMGVAVVAAAMLDRQALQAVIWRLRWFLVLAAMHVCQATLRFWWAPSPGDLFNAHVGGPVMIALGVVLCVLAERLGTRTALARTVALAWSISLGAGVPLLWMQPGVARLTMGNASAIANAVELAPLGIGEFSRYTAWAVCLSPLVSIATPRGRAARPAALFAVALATIAVFISTFTMAAVLAAASLGVLCVQWARSKRRKVSIIRALVVVGAFAGIAAVVGPAVETSPQVEFVWRKATRLLTGVGQTGLADGDETGRGAYFMDEVRQFVKEPIWGYTVTSGTTGNGHSSLSNSLVLFGLSAAWIWIGALLLLARAAWWGLSPPATWNNRAAWLLFASAGVLNPTWSGPGIVIPLVLFTASFNRLGPASGRTCQRIAWRAHPGGGAK